MRFFTWLYLAVRFKKPGINFKTLQDKELFLKLENIIRGGMSSVMGDRYVKSDETKKLLYIDATKLYGHFMSELLPYDKIEIWRGKPVLYKNN